MSAHPWPPRAPCRGTAARIGAAAPAAARARWRRIAALALAALLPAAAPASEHVPPPPQREPLLVTGATLHTVSGATIVDGRMLVERGRITALAGPGEPLPAPAGGPARVLHLPGKHIYPGFVAANTALGLVEVNSVRATLDATETGTLNPNARAVVALNADSELLPVARSNGVLAALTAPQAGRSGLIAGTSALIQLDGWTWEDMTLDAAVALHVHLPSMRLNRAALPPQAAAFADELKRQLEARLHELDDAFDAARAYAAARRADPATPLDSRWEAMRPVFDRQRPVFVHADELAQIRHALGLAARHGLRLVIVGGADAALLADVLRERQVPVIIGGVHELPQRRDDDPATPFRLAAQLAQAGVTFCIARQGGIGAASAERNLPYEAATAAAHGLPRDEALRAITLYPARILGVEDRLGALAPGRLASFIVTDGDPLEITTRVERLFIQGREVDAGNRQQRLDAKYRQRYSATPIAAPAR